MGSLFLIVVIVSCEILGAFPISAEPALNRSVEFELLGHDATTQQRVFASSVRGSKQRCAAGCARQTACTQFCYEPTTKQCLLEDADSDDQEQTGNFTCYIKSINPVCTTNTFTGGKFTNHVWPFPAFDGTFVLDFAVQVPQVAVVSLSVDGTKGGINYEVGLGRNGNTRTAIRRKWNKGDLISIPTEAGGVVSGDEMRRFWLRYDHGSFAFGKHNEAAYLEWTDPSPPTNPPRFIGFRAWTSVPSRWIIYNGCP